MKSLTSRAALQVLLLCLTQSRLGNASPVEGNVYGDKIQNGKAPAPASFLSAIPGYNEAATAYDQISNYSKYVPNPDSYVPNPETYIPRPESLVPNTDSYVQNPESYIPRPESLVPKPDTYVPNPETYVPEPESYVPQAEPYFPELPISVPYPAQDSLLPVPDPVQDYKVDNTPADGYENPEILAPEEAATEVQVPYNGASGTYPGPNPAPQLQDTLPAYPVPVPETPQFSNIGDYFTKPESVPGYGQVVEATSGATGATNVYNTPSLPKPDAVPGYNQVVPAGTTPFNHPFFQNPTNLSPYQNSIQNAAATYPASGQQVITQSFSTFPRPYQGSYSSYFPTVRAAATEVFKYDTYEREFDGLAIEEGEYREKTNLLSISTTIVKKIGEMQRAVTPVLRNMIGDSSGDNTFKICSYSKGRMTATQAVNSFLTEIPHMIKVDANLGQADCRFKAYRAFRVIQDALREIRRDFDENDYISETETPTIYLDEVEDLIKEGIEQITAKYTAEI